MYQDRLDTLLKQADRLAGDSQPIPGLAGHIRRLARRRQLRRHTIIVGMAALVIVTTGMVLLREPALQTDRTDSKTNRLVAESAATPAAQSATGPAEIARLQARIAQLQAEANVRTRMVQQMRIHHEQQQRLTELYRRRAAIGDPLERVRQELEKAAFVTVYQANRKYDELGLKESAMADYRLVIKYHPTTKWAQVARRRLAEIQNKPKGDLL